jgi:hypothetical protein
MYREANLYGHTKTNPTLGLKSPSIQLTEKKFLTWDEVDSKEWGRLQRTNKISCLHGLEVE